MLIKCSLIDMLDRYEVVISFEPTSSLGQGVGYMPNEGIQGFHTNIDHLYATC